MIRTESVARVVRYAAPPRLARWGAQLRGVCDGARGLPHVPTGGDSPALGEATTAYVREQQATWQRALAQLRSRLMDRERRLIAEIRYEAVKVVTQYDVRRRPAPAALARFGQRVAEWRTRADVCRYRAVAVTEQINQRTAIYWDALRRHHRDVPDPAPAHLARWAPPSLQLPESWLRPDTWLSAPGKGDEAARAACATARALALLDHQSPQPPRTGALSTGTAATTSVNGGQ